MNNLLQWLTILAAGAVIAIYGLYRDRKQYPKEYLPIRLIRSRAYHSKPIIARNQS